MKKSIMLSTTIMLIILFVALTTTTFAWYQAQAGEITIDASSTASVTTTGPDSPYLVIGKTASAISLINSSDFEGYNSAGKSAVTAITKVSSPDDDWTWSSSIGVYSVTSSGVFSDTGFTEIASGLTTSNPRVVTFYIRNTSSSFDLTADLSVVDSNISHYCWAVVFDDQAAYSSYHTVSGGTAQSSNSSVTIPRCAIGATIEVKVYIWMDAYVDNSNTLFGDSSEVDNHLSTYSLSNVQIQFSNIELDIS